VQGTFIWTVSAAGNASTNTPHLHFAVWQIEPDRRWSEPAAVINPYPLLTALRPARQAEPRPVGARQSVVVR
jgi:murein DD-endopeptidase MepM/ murein hydrolase activator NlpD